jgi:saccharopine dehydrogenase (NAD+, L-lysine-forming)
MAWMIYGANGYTGQLIAELAKERGDAPLLAGRSEEKVRPLAEKLALPWRAFPLDRPDLRDVALVLHCAGPFSATSRPMVDACLQARAHYLDITGEIPVFESVFARDAEARARGVVLLPGTGFDVVPSDCLAALLKRKLPTATRLELAFAPSGRSSPGTLKTSIEALPQGGVVRRGGKLVPVPPAHEVREISFADKRRSAMAIPWGDVASAFRSTGIPDITVFMAAKPRVIRAARLTRFTAPLLALPFVQQFLKAGIERNVRGPDRDDRARGSVQLWGRASDGARSVEMTMTVPEGYTLTADAALECVRHVLSGAVAPGAWTPAQAFGPDFAASLPGVRVGER